MCPERGCQEPGVNREQGSLPTTLQWRRRRSAVFKRKIFLGVIKAFSCRVSILILTTSWVSRANHLILKTVDTQERKACKGKKLVSDRP